MSREVRPRRYRAYDPEQDLLLPPSLRQWLDDDHLVYFVSDVVDQLDLSGDPRNVRAERGEGNRCTIRV